MAPILEEIQRSVFVDGAQEVRLPISRMGELVLASTEGRYISSERMAEIWRTCKNNEAKAFGVPVIFEAPGSV